MTLALSGSSATASNTAMGSLQSRMDLEMDDPAANGIIALQLLSSKIPYAE
jgi:hypothetical protein